MTKPDYDIEFKEVINNIGIFTQYWGFKNIHGRVWALIFLSKNSLDARSIGENLGISKALVSLTLADLLENNVVLSDGKSEKSTITYRANPNLFSVIGAVLRNREKRMIQQILESIKSLKSMDKSNSALEINISNLNRLEKYTRLADRFLNSLILAKVFDFKVFKGELRP